MQKSARIVFALSLLAAAISFTKFNSCQSFDWATPNQYVHACYSDIPALFSERGLNQGVWAYSNADKAVEYPVITGVVMWVLAKVSPAGDNATENYFYLNVALLAVLFLLISAITFKIRPKFAYLLPVAPAAIASLYINWDLWAIISMMGAIYWFDHKKLDLSALAIGISISTKFIPIFLLLPIALIFLRRKNFLAATRYFLITLSTFVAVNLHVFLTTPEGWLRFYKLNIERNADWGSLWFAADSLGIYLPNINYLSILLLLATFAGIAIYILEVPTTPSLASLSFIVLAIIMSASKVYSPQYVLWLTPLAVIALIDKRDLHAFWIWQGVELVYHLAIWQHLATVTGAKFGLPLLGYSLIILVRIAATAYLVGILLRRGLVGRVKSSNTPNSLREFLFESGKSYP